MKHIKISHIILLLAGILPVACNYLDYDESVGYTKEDVFKYFDRSKQALTAVYAYLPADFGSIGGSMRAAGTDEADYVWTSSLVHRYTDGSWSAISTVDDVWGHFYSGIRAAHIYLENFKPDFPDIKWNVDYPELMEQYQYYPYEARFLRAFFYFELIKRYKNIPLLERTYEPEEINAVMPSDFEDIVEFIIEECNELITRLPESFKNIKGSETGRITQGAVMALKARTLLYAASPLFNTSGNKEKWERAAIAAGELIKKADSEGWYELIDEQYLNNLDSKELILETRCGDSNSFERLNFPIGYEGGESGISPSQNLVDAFEMADGSKFNWNNPDHVRNIYNEQSRDPRLFKTVIVNGSVWKGQTVRSYNGGRNGQPLTGATTTSYYLKKYLVEAVNLNTDNATTARHVWVLFRYGEVLLNYAEALYEATENANYKDDRFTLSPLEALNRVRTRAGMPAAGSNDFRERIRNERRVELAFEDHRFWDVRRWDIGETTTELYGVKIEIKDDNTFTYNRQLVKKRVWDKKMNLYPIANTELFKNHNLKQNTGW